MTLEACVLHEDAVRARNNGYELDVRLAWYRSLPLSCVEGVDLVIDGVAVARDDVTVAWGDRELALADLGELLDDWWFVQDALTIRVPHPEPRSTGEQAEVDLTLATRIPYIQIGPDAALVQRTNVVRSVIVR